MKNRELLKAVYAGNLSQVTNLITQGADIQAKSRINDTPLHLAALNGHEDIIEYLLAQGAPLEVPNSNNDTPLHRAAAKGNVNAFSALVKAKADLSAKNKRGHTPLHLAASEGQLSIVNYVLALRDSASGPLVVRNENDETPLHRAALKGHAQVITALVKGGSDISARNKPGNTPLHLAAASNNNEEVVESLLHSVKGTTEYSSVINALNNIKQTPLHRAAHSGHFNVVKKLLEAGAAVNEKQHDGCTPLHLAITKGISNISIISTPLDAGSDIYKNDETPLHRAAMKGHAQVITALVKGDSDISARNEWGNTPLHLAAASNNNEEVVELLLHSVKGTTEYSSVLNALNNIKQTPLHRAAYCGHLNVVKKLLEAGASVNEKERDGYTPLHLAITKGISHISIISALLDAGSDIYNINNFGNTGAHHAAFNGHITLVESLLSKGFDVNRRNSKGNTLIHLAAHEGHSGMVQLLLTKGAKLDTYNTNEDSPVLMASRLGRTEIVLMLLKAGASPVNPSDGRSVLHAAARGNRLFTCKMILREFGDKVSINSEWKGLTADGYASAAGSAHLAWWLRKKRDSISIESPYRSKWLLCKGDYERSGLNIIKRASTISKRETDWLRKSIEDGTIEMHYMDTDGNTMLHAAVATKNVNTEKALLELGALPIACNHRNESPSTPTVEQLDRRIASYFYALLLNMITQTVKLDIPDDKDSKENLPIVSDRVLQNLRLKAVKVVSKILTLGIPFDPPGSNEKHLLSLAITTSNRTLLPILLAAGLPLTTSHSGLSLLQLAWLNPVYSTWIGMVVTRAVMHRLLAEQIAVKEYGGMITATSEQCKILFKCISELVASLHKEAPHEARFQCDENALTEMFVLACRVGVTTTAWYIWKEGASLYERQSYETPLEAALNTKHMYTAKRLVLDMKSNPFLKGSRNNVLMDEFSSQERLELLEMMFSEEFRRLDRIMEKSKDKEDKRDMQLIILLYMILFLQYRYENNVQKWRSYFEVIRTHFCQMTQTSKRRRSDNPQSAEDMECSQMQKEPSNSAIPDSSENSKTLRFEKNSQTPEDMECSHLQKDPSNSAKSDNSENSKVLRYEKNSQTPEDMEFSYLQKDPSNSAMSGDGGNLETVRDKKKSETTEDTFNWMSRLSEFLKTNCVCEKLFIQNSDVQEEIFQMYSDIGITEAGSKIEAYNTIDEFYDLFATLENLFINHDVGIDELPELMYLLKKSLRISCEDHMPLFLHLLKTVAEVDLDMILNDLCQTRPLHHAAKYNNLSAIVYLLTRCASPTFGDCNGYLPVYYAFMYGHEITGFFLLGELEKIDPDGRINLQSVKEMALYFHQAHREYLILYDLNPTFDANSRFPRVQHCDELLSNCLNNVIKKWEQRGIRDYVHSITVDYNEKETKQVKEEVATFLTSLKNGIATKNSVFEGDLQFVGSSVDNVRLFCPDEYDCNLCLKNISAFPGGGLKCILSKLAKKSAILRDHEKSLTVLSERENVDLFEKTNFLNNFFSTVEEALFEMDLSKYKLKLVLPGIKRTQVGVAFSLMSLGSKYRMLFVDVDLVPTIKAPWPDNLNKPDCGIAKESLEEVHINSLGEGEWRFSFGQAETALMQTLTDEKREVYLACKMLLASFKTENWVPSAIRQRFKYWDGQMFSLSTKGGFALKNSFFQELEIFTEPNEWTTSNLLRRMCSVFGRMCEEIIDPEKLKMQSENANSSVYKAQEDNEDTPRYGGKRIKAFFGGDAEKSSIYLIAPDILVFLKSLNESIIVN